MAELHDHQVHQDTPPNDDLRREHPCRETQRYAVSGRGTVPRRWQWPQRTYCTIFTAPRDSLDRAEITAELLGGVFRASCLEACKFRTKIAVIFFGVY